MMSLPVWLLGPMFLGGGVGSVSGPMFLRRGLCPGGGSLSCRGGGAGGSLSGVSLVWGSLCPWGAGAGGLCLGCFCLGGHCLRDQKGEERAVRILLECFLVHLFLHVNVNIRFDILYVMGDSL